MSDIETLCQWDRRATGPGERRSATWLAEQLRGLSPVGVEIEEYRGQSSWVPSTLAHLGAAALSSFLGLPGRAATALAALSYEADLSGRSHWLRQFLPAGTGLTVSARLPASEQARRTLVLVAHHDAAHCGVIFSDWFTAAARRQSQRGDSAPPTHLLPMLALAGLAAGPRMVQWGARGLLAVTAALALQSSRSSTAPGANDNATGVAAVLELGRRFARNPMPHTDVLLLFTGGEEAAAAGMMAWMQQNKWRLDRRATLFVSLDAIGAGQEIVTPRRDGITAFYAKKDLALVAAAAADIGRPAPRCVDFGNITDAAVASRRGYRSISLLSYRDGWIPHLHQPHDTPENVELSTVTEAIALTQAIAERWDCGE